jgi:hypothetical protein
LKNLGIYPAFFSAVAGFLKRKFQSVECGKAQALNLEAILYGRRRREAACMFFETLVSENGLVLKEF